MKVLTAICLAFALVHGQESGAGPMVDTHYGKVMGSMGESRDGRMFYSFRGIPFGKAPERFQAPEIPDNWEMYKDATKPAPSCITYSPLRKEVVGQEDCLNLNVFTPRLPMEGKDTVLLPVVVYLHPGLNQYGSSEEFDPKYWMDEDVIIVIPNWRQSFFGFLNTNDMYAAGNQGLRDQVLALKWVKQNIEKFGGDKSRVTLLGSASGGSDAVLHTLSPQSKGLFHNVVSMSGTPLSRISMVRNPVRQAKKLGQQVGCPVDSSSALVSCLKEKDAKELLEKMVKLDYKNISTEDLKNMAYFAPTIDKIVTEGQTEEDLVIPKHPLALLKEGKIVNKVPLIIGANEREGVNILTAAVLRDKATMDKVDSKWNEDTPWILLYKDTATDSDAVSNKIREFYFGDKPINKDTFLNLTDVMMDRFVGFGMVSAAKLYSKEAPVYLYYFSHTPETTSLKFLGVENENFGMAHLDDVQYLFKSNSEKLPFPEITKDSKEYELSKGLVKLLSSFAETGKPTKTWGEAKDWMKNEGGELKYWYKLGLETKLESPAPEKFQKRIGFWTELYKTELAKEKETPEVEPF